MANVPISGSSSAQSSDVASISDPVSLSGSSSASSQVQPVLANISQAYINDMAQFLRDALPFDIYQDDPFLLSWFTAVGYEMQMLGRLLEWIYQPELGKAFNRTLLNTLEPIYAGFFAATATGTALTLWEQMLGMQTDTTLSDTTRQNNLLTHMQQHPVAINHTMIEQLLLNIGVVAYIEDPTATSYTFAVHITSPAAAAFTAGIQAQCDKIIQLVKPAHLNYVYISETTWVTMAARRWVDLGLDVVTWANMSY